jgi:predicted MPP superfamily phosphohydrolase
MLPPHHPCPHHSHPTARAPRRWTGWIGRTWARLDYAFRVEPLWLECNRLDVPVRGLPSGFDGLRIAHLSDLHAGRSVPAALLAEAVDLAAAERPDLIAVTGDFVHAGHGHVAQAAACVARLSAPLGVYAVLGNHDYSVRNALGFRRYPALAGEVAAALTARGVRVLRNRHVLFESGGGGLALAGADDLWSGECDPASALAGLPPDVPRVLLAHNPLTLGRLRGLRCDVMLSGHTHGGQVCVPGVGPLALGPRARRHAAGAYRVDETYLYVNKGVGFGLRLRYRTRPEVAVLTLRRA